MKKILSLVIVLVTVFALIGCGPRGYSAEYDVLTIEELREADRVDVKFRVPFGAAIQDVILDLIDSFNDEYPNVHIELNVIGGYNEMKNATILDIGGGNAPTMAVGYPDHFAEYLITESIINLNKFVNDSEVGYTQAELDDFLEGYLAENKQFDITGSFMGLPFNKSTEALYYNKEFFDEFGLSVPTTWDEVKSVSNQIYAIVADIDDNEYPFLGEIATNLANDEFMPMMYDSTGNFFTTIIRQFGGVYTQAIYHSTGVTNVQRGRLIFATNEKAHEALEHMQGLAKDNIINVPEAWEGRYGSNFFIQSQVLMNVGSTAGSVHYSGAIGEWSVAPIPYFNEDSKYVIQQGTNLAIFSQASDLEKLAAWLFIKHLLTPENTASFAMRTGYMPVRSSAYELPEYVEFLNDPLPQQTHTSKVHNATLKYAAEGWTYFVDPAWAGSSTVREEVGIAVTQILAYQDDVAAAIAAAVSRIGQ